MDMWLPIVLALFVAALFTVPIVWMVGWRRPGAAEEENALLSGLFLFALVFLATWAIGSWMNPWGPEVWGVSWLMLLIVGAFVVLLVLVSSPPSPRRYAGGGADIGETATATSEALEGFGLLFWILVVLLLIAGVFAAAI